MFKYGPHCNGCDSNCKIEIKALGSGIATINDTEIYFGYSQNTKTLDDIIYRTQKICKHLCKHYNTQSNTENSFTLKSDIHCDGCDKQCKITCKPKNGHWVKLDDIIYRIQKTCKHLCKHYNTQSNTENSFTLKSDIHCDGCDKQCKITCEPKNGHWIKIGEIHIPGTHTSQYNALLHGLKICKQCQHYKTR